MDAYNFDHPVVLRKSKEKPKLKSVEIYFTATVICPDCNSEGEVLLNRDAEVYHECNEGNVRAELPKIELPKGLIKHLHKNKFIDNLKFLEKLDENKENEK